MSNPNSISKEIKQDLNIKQQSNQTQIPQQSSQKEEYQEYEDTNTTTYPQQLEAMGDFILDTRNLDHQEINTKKFKTGIDEYSIIAGNMAVLTSMGIESKTALEFIERDLIRKHELKIIQNK